MWPTPLVLRRRYLEIHSEECLSKRCNLNLN